LDGHSNPGRAQGADTNLQIPPVVVTSTVDWRVRGANRRLEEAEPLRRRTPPLAPRGRSPWPGRCEPECAAQTPWGQAAAEPTSEAGRRLEKVEQGHCGKEPRSIRSRARKARERGPGRHDRLRHEDPGADEEQHERERDSENGNPEE